MSNKQSALFDRILELAPDERRVLGLAMPPLRRFWPTLTWGLLWAISVVALLATSAYLITRASLIIHILWLGIAIVAVRMFAIGRAVFRYLKHRVQTAASDSEKRRGRSRTCAPPQLRCRATKYE